MKNQIEYKVWAKYALFSDPIMRVGGEKYSYQIPTYEALKGITESIYWKPTIIWYIDKVRIVNKIETQSMGIKTLKYSERNKEKKSDLSMYSYLRNVEYHVIAHFEFNENRLDLKKDWNSNKHLAIAKRSLKSGGRRDIFLGTRECQGYVEPFNFDDGESYYDNVEEMYFGTMIHGIDYPDENKEESFNVRFCRPIMKNGIVEFERPEDIEIVRPLRKYNKKEFNRNNFKNVEATYDEIFGGE